VDVFEQGTRAAAATGFGADLTAMPETSVFTADHPFVFLIRDTLTGSILFMGRVEDPS
jgi:serpin B